MTTQQGGQAVDNATIGGSLYRPAKARTPALALVQNAGFWAALIFAVALLTRLCFMSVPLDIDEGMWMRRGPLFIIALLHGDWAGTYLRHHPGVTNMWLTGAALSLRYALHAWLPPAGVGSLSDYLSSVAQAAPGAPLWAYTTARSAAAVVTSGCLAGIYLLSRRLFGPGTALLAAAILLFEPFFVAYQRSITTDANQANFTWLALLAFLLYGRAFLAVRRRGGWLVLAGVCYGLAGLSKVSALLSLPAFALWAGWLAWSSRRDRRAWLRLAGDLLLGTSLAAGTALLLWPALWQNLPGTLARMAADLGQEIEGHYQFFLGQTSLAPGALFYPVVLLFRLSPLLLLGSLWCLVLLASRRLRRYLPDRPALYLVLANVVVLLAAMTGQASKIDRYIIPVVPGLALLAAAGIWATAQAWPAGQPADAAAESRSRPRLGILLAAIVAAQLAVFLPHYPVLLTYFNPLLGGPRAAERVLMVGNGELLDRAAAWLNTQPGAEQAITASWYSGSFAPYYEGQTVEEIRDPATSTWPLARAQYVVTYINQFQRRQPPEVTYYFGPQRPLYVVQAHGADYARVYAGPSVPGGQLPPGQAANLDFGPYARLLGYELQAPEVAAGETAVINLYWQAREKFPAPDFSVYLGLRRADGQLFAKADNAPVGGMLPVDQWQPGQVIRDAQQVRILPGTPPGEYGLEIGMYAGRLDQDLSISAGGQPAGTRASLGRLRVTRPSAGPNGAAGAPDDLGIAHQWPLANAPLVGSARLTGYEWAAADRWRAGDAVPVTLLWRAGGPVSPTVPIYLQLSDGANTYRRSQGHLLGGDYAASAWAEGELVRDSWSALLPADAPAGRYQLSLVAMDNGRGQRLVDLGNIEVETRPRSAAPPQMTFRQTAELGGLARLVGYDWRAAPAGRTLPLTLYWQAAGEPERNYARFVHVLGPDGKIVAQTDGPPGGSAAPMTGWVADEYIADVTELTLPPDMPAGTYHAAVGLYDPATGRRLATPDGLDRIVLDQPLHLAGTGP